VEHEGDDFSENLKEGAHENAHEATPRPALPFSMGQDPADPAPPLGAQTDPVEAALARAITLASEAGQWDTVATLSRELSARRLARSAPDVASIETAREKRGGRS
jgi:hypothetical protein